MIKGMELEMGDHSGINVKMGPMSKSFEVKNLSWQGQRDETDEGRGM